MKIWKSHKDKKYPPLKKQTRKLVSISYVIAHIWGFRGALLNIYVIRLLIIRAESILLILSVSSLARTRLCKAPHTFSRFHRTSGHAQIGIRDSLQGCPACMDLTRMLQKIQAHSASRAAFIFYSLHTILQGCSWGTRLKHAATSPGFCQRFKPTLLKWCFHFSTLYILLVTLPKVGHLKPWDSRRKKAGTLLAITMSLISWYLLSLM